MIASAAALAARSVHSVRRARAPLHSLPVASRSNFSRPVTSISPLSTPPWPSSSRPSRFAFSPALLSRGAAPPFRAPPQRRGPSVAAPPAAGAPVESCAPPAPAPAVASFCPSPVPPSALMPGDGPEMFLFYLGIPSLIGLGLLCWWVTRKVRRCCAARRALNDSAPEPLRLTVPLTGGTTGPPAPALCPARAMSTHPAPVRPFSHATHPHVNLPSPTHPPLPWLRFLPCSVCPRRQHYRCCTARRRCRRRVTQRRPPPASWHRRSIPLLAGRRCCREAGRWPCGYSVGEGNMLS